MAELSPMLKGWVFFGVFFFGCFFEVMLFVRQEKNVQNLPRRGECLQEPLPREGVLL